jgi:hypothetical protein
MNQNKDKNENAYWSDISAKDIVKSFEMEIGGISCGKQTYCTICKKYHTDEYMCCNICKYKHNPDVSCIVAIMLKDLEKRL